MDPITATALVAAVTAGITSGATDLSKKVLVDAYEGLKNTLKRKFGVNSEVVRAVDALDADPKSQGRQMVLREETSRAKVDEDADIRKAAEALLQQLKSQPGGTEHVNNVQTAIGSGIAQAGVNSTAQVFAPPNQVIPPKL